MHMRISVCIVPTTVSLCIAYTTYIRITHHPACLPHNTLERVTDCPTKRRTLAREPAELSNALTQACIWNVEQ